MQAAILQIRARCAEIVEKAKALYGMDLSQVRISFDLRGRSAGKAFGPGYRLPGSAYTVKLNRDMMTREAFEHVIKDTVPHEYAHVVCYMDPSKGKNHDYGWARVCRDLGGSGARTHNEDVVYGKGITYEYTTDRGHKVRLSERRHRYVQGGGRLSYRKGLGVITQACAHSVVGIHGQTLAQPVVRVAPATAPLVITPVQVPPTVQVQVPPTVTPIAQQYTAGESKAATSRRIMLSGYRGNQSYETIISAMMLACGYNRQLARGTFKANAHKVGIPASFG